MNLLMAWNPDMRGASQGDWVNVPDPISAPVPPVALPGTPEFTAAGWKPLPARRPPHRSSRKSHQCPHAARPGVSPWSQAFSWPRSPRRPARSSPSHGPPWPIPAWPPSRRCRRRSDPPVRGARAGRNGRGAGLFPRAPRPGIAHARTPRPPSREGSLREGRHASPGALEPETLVQPEKVAAPPRNATVRGGTAAIRAHRAVAAPAAEERQVDGGAERVTGQPPTRVKPTPDPPGTPRPRPRTRSPPRHPEKETPTHDGPQRPRVVPAQRASDVRAAEPAAPGLAPPEQPRRSPCQPTATARPTTSRPTVPKPSQTPAGPGPPRYPGPPPRFSGRPSPDRPCRRRRRSPRPARPPPRYHRLRRAGRRRPGSRDVPVLGSGAPDRHSHAAAERILRGLLPDRERRRLLEPRPLAQPYPRGA